MCEFKECLLYEKCSSISPTEEFFSIKMKQICKYKQSFIITT